MTNEGLKGCLISQEDIYTITPCNSDLSNWKWDWAFVFLFLIANWVVKYPLDEQLLEQ